MFMVQVDVCLSPSRLHCNFSADEAGNLAVQEDWPSPIDGDIIRYLHSTARPVLPLRLLVCAKIAVH